MKIKGRLSIRTSILLAISLTVASTVLAAGAIYGYQLYRSARYVQRLRAKAIAETYAAHALALVRQSPTPDLRPWLNGMTWHPATRLLAVLDPQGRVMALRGSEALLDRYLKHGAAEHGAGGDDGGLSSVEPAVWTIETGPGEEIPDITLVAMPLRDPDTGHLLAMLVCAERTASDLALPSTEVYLFFVGLLGIAGLGVALGTWYLKASVLTPLSLLSQRGLGGTLRAVIPPLPVHRPDEIGQLAKVLTDLHQDREQWRESTVQLRHSISQRVSNETARITKELQQTRREVWTDPLTGLGNRRLFDDKFAQIYDSQHRSGQDIAVVMIDVDNFKSLNDTLGHQAGDELLRFMGELLRQCLREDDLAVRMGGDEFMLILPGVSAEDAFAIAERTVRLFAQRAALLPSDPKPTMSSGIAALMANRPSSAKGLINMADQALYVAKGAGKGQAVIYSPSLRAAKPTDE